MTYEKVSVHAPRLAGAAIRAVAPLTDAPVVGAIIRAQMLSQVGMDALRRASFTEPPTLSPIHVPRTPPAAAAPLDLQALATAPDGGDTHGFRFETVADFHAAYRAGRTQPAQVAQRVLAATEAGEAMHPPMRTLIAQRREDVTAQAEASSARWREGKPLSPLDGVPVAIKDELYQAGYPTTVGTRFMGARGVVTPAQEATAVARLRAAGAVLIGKTNMHELGMGITGINPHHGSARNPYDPARFTGGSSSGTAAAVAAGLCPVALGADGGGSIRIPAALCGVVGLKATFGRVSEYGAAPLCWSVGHVGPMGATARDVALAYAVCAGPDPNDAMSRYQPPPTLDGFGDADLSDVRLGVFWPWVEDAEPDVVAAFRRTLEGLKVAGATVVEVELADLGLVRLAHLVTIATEMAVSRAAHFAAEPGEYGHDVRLNMALAEVLQATDFVQAQRMRTRALRMMDGLFDRVDAVVTPTTGGTAGLIAADTLSTGESDMGVMERMMRFILLGNLTGVPAISFPAGYDRLGLPVGMHAMGRPWDESLLLSLAHAAEHVVERKAPKVHATLLA
ncbi:MAG: amidase [Deltaproteobacteria bacterium]|nr:amidase [Deltaproteobacteria bacterium]